MDGPRDRIEEMPHRIVAGAFRLLFQIECGMDASATVSQAEATRDYNFNSDRISLTTGILPRRLKWSSSKYKARRPLLI